MPKPKKVTAEQRALLRQVALTRRRIADVYKTLPSNKQLAREIGVSRGRIEQILAAELAAHDAELAAHDAELAVHDAELAARGDSGAQLNGIVERVKLGRALVSRETETNEERNNN